MESKSAPAAPFQFSDLRQARIYRRLLLVGAGPASFFRSACQIMTADPLLDATTHIVGHLVREIESAIRAVLASVTNEEGQVQQILTVLKHLGIPETDPIKQAWIGVTGKGNKYALHARAHRDNLAAPRPVDQEFVVFWDNIQNIFDVVLDRFEARYLDYQRILDQLIAKEHPTAADATFLQQRVPNNHVAFDYFFGRLTSPSWLEPLKTEGFFTTPPAPIVDHAGGTIQFLLWPAADYLVRMAPKEPEAVRDILSQVPPTSNVYVLEALINAVLALPVDQAATLVSQIESWFDIPYELVCTEQVGALIVRLAQGGRPTAALAITHSLLIILPELPEEATPGGTSSQLRPKPRARLDLSSYQQVLTENIPIVVPIMGQQVLPLLCGRLENAVRYSLPAGAEARSEDLSHIWRPTIKQRGRNTDHGLKEVLVSAVRDTAEQLVYADPTLVSMVVTELERHGWNVFQRLALHLLYMFPDLAPALVAERLTNHDLFVEHGLWHEYMLLAQRGFARLTSEEQAIILGWIEKGPDLDRYKTLPTEWTGQVLSDADLIQHARMWRRDRLAPLSEFLPDAWRSQLVALNAELADVSVPTFMMSPTGVITEPTSPGTTPALASLSVTEIVALLREWQPTSGFIGPSVEGMSRELEAVVPANPERFAVEAAQFQQVDPTYVHSLLVGLGEAVKQKRPFQWLPVLDLCRWVVEQPREVVGRTLVAVDLDRDWGWTRREVGQILISAFESEPSALPIELCSVIWDILLPLTNDPDPTAEQEAIYSQRESLAMRSISTTRGVAMHALVLYGLWLQNSLKATSKEEPNTSIFLLIPEVRKVLEQHLDPNSEPSLAIRAVYGERFPQLLVFDREWTTHNVASIFPQEDALRPFYGAAWESYIVLWRPDEAIFDVLQQQYSRAIDDINKDRVDRQQIADPNRQLAKHLMWLYYRGKLSLSAPDGLLARLFAKAPDELRADVIEDVGRMIQKTPSNMTSETTDRLKMLWEQRINKIERTTNRRTYKRELGAFGWWFASALFDDHWAIAQLQKGLQLGSCMRPNHLVRLVVERLAQLAATMPTSAVACLALIVDSVEQRWQTQSWHESARTILRTALHNQDEIARQEAHALVNRLAARGIDFRDLLTEDPTPPVAG